MNIKLILSYDGTNYHGWQQQENVPTVQETLFDAIKKIMNDVESVQGVSRTDAGVHAISYAANFHTEKPIPIDRIPKAVNSCLPPDIRVVAAEAVDENFNSRFDAVSKTYIYRIINDEVQPPFERNYSWNVSFNLNVYDMQKATEQLVGEKDFSSFCASGEERENHIRKINYINISKKDDIITIEINANSYLYNMVRIIAGTLVNVGRGEIPYENIQSIIESKDRTKAGQTAPPQGLFLKEVNY